MCGPNKGIPSEVSALGFGAAPAPSMFSTPNLITAGQAFSAVGSSVGAYYSTLAQKSATKGQAALDDINAKMAETQAQSALYAGQKEEQASELKTAQVKGDQRAALAANGVDLGSTTAVNLLTSTDVVGEIDANTIAANAVRQAWGFRTQAANIQNEATMKRASAAGMSPLTSASTSLLTSASSIGTTRYLMNKGFYGAGSTSGIAGFGS